jgi:hypothetical protein
MKGRHPNAALFELLPVECKGHAATGPRRHSSRKPRAAFAVIMSSDPGEPTDRANRPREWRLMRVLSLFSLLWLSEPCFFAFLSFLPSFFPLFPSLTLREIQLLNSLRIFWVLRIQL